MRKSLPYFIFISSLYGANASADPIPPDGEWRGSLSAGVSVASGNTTAANFNIGADGTRVTDLNKLAFTLTALYGAKKNDDGSRSETANLARASGKYDHNLSDKVFSFVSLDLEHDKLQLLDLRSVFGLGMGYHLVKTDKNTFDVFSGATYNREKYSELTRNSAELVLGEESTHKLTDTTSFRQRFALFPNLKDTGEFRAQFDSGLVTAINARLGLQLTLSDRYQSNPQPSVKKNDLLFLTSVTYKFGPK